MRRGFAALIGALVIASITHAQQTPRFRERVDVTRVVIDVRVIDDRGDPVVGLIASDFQVEIDGRRSRVESATWIGGSDTGAGGAIPGVPIAPDDIQTLGPGRLVVFLFQKDLEPSRIVGLMRMLLKGRQFLETLTANDRVAILSFDSHLKVWTDFTNNRERLDRVLEHGILFERPPPVQAPPEPSLVERLDPARGRRTYTIERALELIADALEPLPGAKSLVLIGHGFGHFSRTGVRMDRDYDTAREALIAARTSVFSLDVTQADYHSLEAGLQIVAEETGGFYARTHVFPDLAVRRLSGALAGYYVLFVERPPGHERPKHEIDVKVLRSSGRILATRTYEP
jgi:VWFA-related protein